MHRKAYGFVSIHAPTRGATCLPTICLPPTMCFNPRTHTGCDVQRARCGSIGRVSIHAPTRGATSFNLSTLMDQNSFNPRTHTGCDAAGYSRAQTATVSIHAPTRGATYCKSLRVASIRVSIHAPTRGATRGKIAVQQTIRFQSTHPHGVRLYIQQMSEYQLNKVSISRS